MYKCYQTKFSNSHIHMLTVPLINAFFGQELCFFRGKIPICIMHKPKMYIFCNIYKLRITWTNIHVYKKMCTNASQVFADFKMQRLVHRLLNNCRANVKYITKLCGLANHMFPHQSHVHSVITENLNKKGPFPICCVKF